MINVLLFAPCHFKGGISNWTRMVVNYFSNSSDIKLDLIGVGYNGKPSYELNFLQRVFYGLLDCRRVKRDFKKIIKTHKIDVVHFTTTGSLSLYRDRAILRIAKKHKIPTVMHIRMGRFPEIYAKKNWEWRFFKKNIDVAHKIIAIDKNTYDCVSKNYRKKTIEILNPIDIKKIDGIKTGFRNKNILVFVGWVVKTKGIEELLKAFNFLKTRFPLLKLKIIGPFDEKYMNYLRLNFNLLDILFVGPLDNKACLQEIANSELFVFPTYTEGCPNVVLESMLCKTPIIASKVGSIPELLSNECGCLIESKNVNDIIDKVELLMNNHDMQTKLVSNAFAKVTGDLSIDNTMKKYVAVWKEVIDA